MNEEVEVLGKWLSERMWRKSGSLTPGELAVVKALLPPDDPRTPKLIRQAEEAPEVTRMRITPSSYEATIPFVRNSFNLVDLDADVTSPELELIISGSLKPVSFRIKLLRGGFLHQIEGESIDGSDWDIHWEPSSESLSEVAGTRVVENWIPVSISEEERLTVVRDIEDWLRVPRGHISKFSSDELSVRRGCGPEDLAVCERRAGLTLPRQYKELLRISDGLTLHRGRDYAINGTSDLYHVDLDYAPFAYWLVTDLYEKGAMIMPAAGIDDVVIYLARPSGPPDAVSPLREYVLDSLALLESTGGKSEWLGG